MAVDISLTFLLNGGAVAKMQLAKNKRSLHGLVFLKFRHNFFFFLFKKGKKSTYFIILLIMSPYFWLSELLMSLYVKGIRNCRRQANDKCAFRISEMQKNKLKVCLLKYCRSRSKTR